MLFVPIRSAYYQFSTQYFYLKMPYDISLVAQNDKYSLSYLALIEKIKQHFPQFKHQYYDLKHWEEVFEDRTTQEILQKGLGIKLEAEFYDGIPKEREVKEISPGFVAEIRYEDWIEISFWEDGFINLAVPNYPHREINIAMVDILSVVRFLEQEGFALDHPIEERVISKDEVEAFLYRDYLNRQVQVEQVQKIVYSE